MNDFNNWWITSDSDRSCFLLSRLSISSTSFEVLNDRNPDFACRIIYTILDKSSLVFNVYLVDYVYLVDCVWHYMIGIDYNKGNINNFLINE